MADQRPVLALPGRGPVRLGDHVAGEELGEDLGVELVGLLGRFGDDPELLGIGQDDLLGQGLDQLDEPLVAGGGLDDDLERLKLLEETRRSRRSGCNEECLRVMTSNSSSMTQTVIICLWRSTPT